MANNRGEQENGLRHEFSDPGGHVIWTSEEFIEPVSVTQIAAGFVIDIIRWALEHKGVNVANGDVVAGHRTINNWKVVIGNKIALTNSYFGYASWRP
jgi:hypothetical protein